MLSESSIPSYRHSGCRYLAFQVCKGRETSLPEFVADLLRVSGQLVLFSLVKAALILSNNLTAGQL
jgi:hypothetical protein